MPTLLSINNYFYYRGGAETVFLEHNRIFEEHGWQVVPFAMKHPKNLETSWPEYFVEALPQGVDIDRHDMHASERRVCSLVDASSYVCV